MEQIVGMPNASLPSCNPGQPFDPKTCSSNFEAYAGLKQVVNGMIAPSPCGTMGDGLTPCFPVTSVETSHLRRDSVRTGAALTTQPRLLASATTC